MRRKSRGGEERNGKDSGRKSEARLEHGRSQSIDGGKGNIYRTRGRIRGVRVEDMIGWVSAM